MTEELKHYSSESKKIQKRLETFLSSLMKKISEKEESLNRFSQEITEKDEQIFLLSQSLKEKEEEGVSFVELTNLLKPLILAEHGKEVEVKPQIIIEVGYEEIQHSPTYESGYALRFPRFLRLRDEKPIDESSTIDYVEQLVREQKK